MDSIEYKGNKFKVELLKSWYRRNEEYCVCIEKINSEQVWLPNTYNGIPVTEWDESDSNKSKYAQVHLLYVPASIKTIMIYNDIFPELEQVEIDPANSEFISDGRTIITLKGSELLYCPVCKGEYMEVPNQVKGIRSDAFYGTRYTEIKFPKKEIRIDGDAFKGSKWLEKQEDFVTVGAMLYKIPKDVKCLKVPSHVRKFHEDLFDYYHVPESLETPVLPAGRDIEKLDRYGRCHTLEVTSAKAGISLTHLRKWSSLENIVIAEEHKKYKTLEGVIYSKDMKNLVWYPSGKRREEFRVPDCVQKIGEFAFAKQKYLKRIILPESVRILGAGAFAGCERLEEIKLSGGIKEIPDSGSWRGTGVFAECKNLKSIALPDKLNYLGSFAFYDSGLCSVTFGKNLEQIGEYALMAENLKTIALPQSVKRVGKGALFFVERMEVYEGTAKGIVAAVNANWPDTKNSIMNWEWNRCDIRVLHKRSDKKSSFLIPGSLKKSAIYHLEMAWNSDRIDYEEYDQCLSEITDPEEKIEFAEQGIRRVEGEEDNIYMEYIRKVSFKMGYRLLEKDKKQDFLLFLKQDFLSENSLRKLLEYSNEKGETVCSAYLTEALNKKKRKGSSFRL